MDYTRKETMADEKKKQDPVQEGAEKNERYMEGNYDNKGNVVRRYKQIADDEHRSVQMSIKQQVKHLQK